MFLLSGYFNFPRQFCSSSTEKKSYLKMSRLERFFFVHLYFVRNETESKNNES